MPQIVKKRDDLTLRISFDEGKSWKISIPVDGSGDRKYEG